MQSCWNSASWQGLTELSSTRFFFHLILRSQYVSPVTSRVLHIYMMRQFQHSSVSFLILQKPYGRMKNKSRIELALFVKGKCSEELQSLTTYFGKFFCPLATQAVSNDIIVGLLLQQVTCWRNIKSLEYFTPKELEKYSAVSLLGFIRLKKKSQIAALC